MMGRQLNPGSVNVRLGRVLERYEDALDQGDLERASNNLIQIRTYIGPFMTAKEKANYRLLPGYSLGDDRHRGQVVQDMENQREYLLCIAKDHGVFAKPTNEVGEAVLGGEEVEA